MPPPTVTLAISLASIAQRYGADFAGAVLKASGCDGKCGVVWMKASDYTQLMIEWATNNEGPADRKGGHGWQDKPEP